MQRGLFHLGAREGVLGVYTAKIWTEAILGPLTV